MPINPQEDVLKRLQGIKDPRGLMGEMARGTNMYPGGDAARTGGGPNIGRPPENPGEPSRVVNPTALSAIQQRAGAPQPPRPVDNMAISDLQAKVLERVPQPAPMQAGSMASQKAAPRAIQALKAAAQRRLQR